MRRLKSDRIALFGDAASGQSGALEVEGSKFADAMSGVQAPADLLIKDTGVILLGIDLYNEYRSGGVEVHALTLLFSGGGMLLASAATIAWIASLCGRSRLSIGHRQLL